MQRYLVINAGSSSLKFAVFNDGKLALKGQVAGIGTKPELKLEGQATLALHQVQSLEQAGLEVLKQLAGAGFPLSSFQAVGHRLVHGGTVYVKPVVLTPEVMVNLQQLADLAPLHMPFSLMMIALIQREAPALTNVACFDTAFHATQSIYNQRFPIPIALHDKGYRRYGFHGLNYAHVVRTLPTQTGKALPEKLLAAHLGNGSSMCAIHHGKSLATTMGFSTADGLVMGTRSGAIDPGLLLALMTREGMDAAALEKLLYKQSGLLALSGESSDMQRLLNSDQPESAFAVEYYCYHAARWAGSLVAGMGGIDAVVFTGGIGENAGAIRQKIMGHLSWLSLTPDQVIVVVANEEQEIALQMADLLS